MQYSLQKYRGRHTRHRCPSCRIEEVFVHYVDESGQMVSPLVGRCNREDNCGYHLKPRQYFEDKGDYRECIIVPSRPQSDFYNTIPQSLCDRSFGLESNFAQWLLTKFPSERVEIMARDYRLGMTKDKAAIFWQIDLIGDIRTGKIMNYNPTTGRNTKKFDWAHRKIGKPDFVLRQCLDGEHLLTKYPDRPVLLVESYKNSRTVACLTDYFVVVSTDCKGGFNIDRCRSLKGKKVMALADCGAYADWERKAPEIAATVGCNIVVVDFLERITTAEQKASGYDIADWIVEQIDDGVQLKYIEDKLIEHYPFIHPRTEKLLQSLIKKI